MTHHMMIGPPIAKEAVDDDRALKLRTSHKNIFSATYNSINVDIYQCEVHSNEFFITAQALGVTLNMLYWVNSMQIGLNELLQEVFQDYCAFVIAVRNDEHQVTH